MNRKMHLNVSISRTLRGDSLPFELVIDGDRFYCISYRFAIRTLLEILIRDEI